MTDAAVEVPAEAAGEALVRRNAELTSALQGAYSIIRVLVHRAGGSIEIPHDEVVLTLGTLNFNTDKATGDFHVTLGSRTQRRAKR